jgi:hypothetical protein
MAVNQKAGIDWLVRRLIWERTLARLHARFLSECGFASQGGRAPGCDPPSGGCTADRPATGSEHDRAARAVVVLG